MYSRRWLIAALAAWMLASACSQFNTNLSVQTSSSTLTFVSPSTATIGNIPAGGLPITATGTGFVTGAFILWNGVQLADTTYVSSNTLTATVPASSFPATGTAPMTLQVAIQIPGSSVSGTSNVNNTTNYANTTEVSNIINFTIYPPAGPAPIISSVMAPPNSMASIPYCGPNGFTLTVNGSNFLSGSTVNWSSASNPAASGPARATSFVSSNQLTAAILPSDVAFPGTAAVSVSTPSATSTASQFTMTTPATSLPLPSIASTSQNAMVNGVPVGTPNSVPARTPMFTLTVNGSSLLPCSTVSFGGDVMPTTYVSQTQLTAIIPASEVAMAGAGGTGRNVNVTVSTIGPGGGTSVPFVFVITP